ncbi:hypothetical protein SDC9_138522 [bioreactor metagenome]|uniref:Uncharacterized protein n=1 Tax=bioreactor metagenome TaxID=1076179 RepID=A0A645DPJ0_9ZZZZ
MYPTCEVTDETVAPDGSAGGGGLGDGGGQSAGKTAEVQLQLPEMSSGGDIDQK